MYDLSVRSLLSVDRHEDTQLAVMIHPEGGNCPPKGRCHHHCLQAFIISCVKVSRPSSIALQTYDGWEPPCAIRKSMWAKFSIWTSIIFLYSLWETSCTAPYASSCPIALTSLCQWPMAQMHSPLACVAPSPLFLACTSLLKNTIFWLKTDSR